MKAPILRLALLVLPLVGLAGCKPEPPPTDEPPEPKAVAADAKATELRDAIQQPIEQAKAVDGAMQAAADQQNADVAAATD